MVRYLDIGGRFLNPDGTISKELMPDFLHLSLRGYEIWAEVIEPVMQDLLAERQHQAFDPTISLLPTAGKALYPIGFGPVSVRIRPLA